MFNLVKSSLNSCFCEIIYPLVISVLCADSALRRLPCEFAFPFSFFLFQFQRDLDFDFSFELIF